MAQNDELIKEELEKVENVLTTTEAFIEKYQKQLLIGIGSIVLVVLIAISFNNFYLQPREVSAQNEMYKSQSAFAADSFKVALEGNGVESIGFKEIASSYSYTSSGNLANAYAGICYYKMGQFEDAAEYLNKYDGKDNYFATSVKGLLGDCYVELGDTSKAVSYFEKAADKKNEILSPVYLKKAALVYESQKDFEKAEKNYTIIKEKYPKSSEAVDIDKYIARVQK